MANEDPTPKVSSAERAVTSSISPLIRVADERLARLCSWLRDGIANIEDRKRKQLIQINRTRQVLDSENPDPPLRPGASHISVPLLMAEHDSTHVAIKRNIFGHKPPVKIRLAGGRREVNDTDVTGPLNRFSAFLDGQMRNTRALDAESTIATVAATQTSDGTGQWAVIPTPPLQHKIYDTDNPKGRKVWQSASVRWEPLRFEDTIFFNGYGTDFSRMPFCGFYAPKTWGEIKLWESHGYYYKDAIKKVVEFYEREPTSTDDRPMDQRVHKVAELCAAYDIDGDGFLEQILIDYHVASDTILRVSWNRFGTHRPIVAAQYGLPAKTLDYLGSGLGKKLEGSQTEASMIHNLGIEAGKRGIANILVGKENTGIDDELGGDEVVMPGDYYATDDPKEDIQSIPLGDPRAVEAAIALESITQNYAQRITGRDEGAQGQLDAGKRVSPKIGVPILREGRTARENATNALGAALQEAIYLTITAWQFHKPENAFRMVLEPEDIPIVEALIFTPSAPDSDIRDRVLVNVVARDVAATEEQRHQKLMMTNQFLAQYYDRINLMLEKILMAQINPQTAPLAKPMRDIQMLIIEKMHNGVEEMLRASEEVEDPQDWLIELETVNAALDEIASGIQQQGTAPTPAVPPQQPAAAPDEIDNAGGGVT